MTIERVRSIAGYEGLYSVSDSGVVTSEGRVIIRSDGRASADDFATLADSYYLKHTGLEPERGAENG